MPISLLLSILVATSNGVEVSGRIEMPALCSTTLSPAVVVLEPREGARQVETAQRVPGSEMIIGQRGLQFEPRVSAARLGRTLRFTNSDTETHSVHVQGQGNRSIAPGQHWEFQPTRPGLYTVSCDIHSHMRAFAVVGDSPWVKACDAEGQFRFRDVPPGDYQLKVWHEAGGGLKVERQFEVHDAVDLGTISVAGRPRTVAVVAGSAQPWSEVNDQIGVYLASSLKEAARPGGLKRARQLAQDAYFQAFELSRMETAVGQVLGSERLHALEAQFKDFFGPTIAAVASRRKTNADGVAETRALLLELSRAAHELDTVGVVDGAHLGVKVATAAETSAATKGADVRSAQLATLAGAFQKVQDLANAGKADEAGSTMLESYFGAFEPIETDLRVLDFPAVASLETRFNALRSQVNQGLRGDPLAASFTHFLNDITRTIHRADSSAASGGFTPAFLASLGIILREGVEVILLLGMLLALAAKVGHEGALRSIRWGVGLAVVASGLTALALNRMLAATQGRTRELMEGVVMLSATAVLVYVSYWLIAQAESKRWTDYLKRQARKAAEVGGFGTLGLTAFLAIYREGAETALMYQAQAVLFGSTRMGGIGLLAGLGLGLVVLAALYKVLRTATVRLPMRAFFQVTGLILFTMAVIFAGKGVAELQSCGFLKVTPLAWLGQGLPILGIYPNTQVLSVQGILLLGALAAFALLNVPRAEPTPLSPGSSRVGTASVGV